MPAKSKKQREAMAIAEHSPSKLYSRNKGLKKMSKKQLHDFASTPEKNLPKSKVKSEPKEKKERNTKHERSESMKTERMEHKPKKGKKK